MAKEQYDPKLLNLTSNEICIYNESESIIDRLRSRGELRICTMGYINYPLQHIHYYDAATGIEAGISVSPAKIINLDKKSPGYAAFNDNLTKEDIIIVSLPVAQFMISEKRHFVPQIFVVSTDDQSVVRDKEGNIIGVKRLEWCFEI